MSREDAEKKAAAKLEWAMSRVMYYDGPIPKILKGSRWDADLVENNSRSSAFKHWHTSIEYYKKDLMPKIHHYEWKGTKSVGVVIPCYNNLSTLKITLPQWKKMRYDNYTVTVVDDGSPADSGIKEYVESLGYKYCYNDTGNTYSISSARNLGIWNTDSSRILFVDSDIIPDSYLVSEHVYNSKNDVITAGIRHGIDRCVTFLQGCSIKDMNSVWKELSDSTWYENNPDEASKLLIEAMERYDFSNWWAAYGSKPMISVFSDRIVTSSWFGSSTLHIPIIVDKDRHEEFLRVHRGESEPNWTMVHGHNFSVDRRHLLEINGFDEDFDGQWGAEENDLVFRLIKKGLVVKPLITAIGYHINHRSRSVKGGDNNNNLFISKMSHDIVRRRPRSWEK
jgi:glycosyltransferase involved in cell wall biosynthesis